MMVGDAAINLDRSWHSWNIELESYQIPHLNGCVSRHIDAALGDIRRNGILKFRRTDKMNWNTGLDTRMPPEIHLHNKTPAARTPPPDHL